MVNISGIQGVRDTPCRSTGAKSLNQTGVTLSAQTVHTPPAAEGSVWRVLETHQLYWVRVRVNRTRAEISPLIEFTLNSLLWKQFHSPTAGVCERPHTPCAALLLT